MDLRFPPWSDKGIPSLMTDDPSKLSREELLELVYVDSVTRLKNRRALEARLIEEVRRAKRDHADLCVLLIDVDYFKLVLDTVGELWADRILNQVARILERNLPSNELLFHAAKDCFCLLLSNTSITEASKLATKLSRAVAKGKYPGHELFQQIYPSGQLTVSIGVTRLAEPLPNEQDLLTWADYAVYKAKRRGRNTVIVQDGPPHSGTSALNPLSLFESISSIFSLAGSLEDRLAQTVAAIQQHLSSDVCSIYLLENNVLVLRATKGLNPESIGKVTLKKNEGLTGLAVETLTPIVSRDAANHPRFKYFPQTGEEQYGSYLGVPILYDNDAIGVLVLQTKALQDFSEEILSAVKSVAGLLGGLLASFVQK